MKNTHTITHQLLNIPITLCYTDKAFSKFQKKHYKSDEHIEYVAVCNRWEVNGHTSLVIGIKEHYDKIELQALLVHELSHAVTMLMNFYNIKDDEFISYTLQWMYSEFITFLEEVLNV